MTSGRHRAGFAQTLLALFVVGATPPQAASAPPASLRDRILVSADWVKAHATDKDLVLLQVGDKATFDANHIAGARFLPMDALSTSGVGEGGRTLEVAQAKDCRKHLGALVISDTSHIVVYFGSGAVPAATRIVFTLDAAGF